MPRGTCPCSLRLDTIMLYKMKNCRENRGKLNCCYGKVSHTSISVGISCSTKNAGYVRIL